MVKPVFRWTMYQTNENGFQVFTEAIHRTPISLGRNRFDYRVSYNGEDEQVYNHLLEIVSMSSVPIKVVRQNPKDMPITLSSGNNLLGMWKVCPPRVSPDTHEIICDNDIIFMKPCSKIDQFLSSNNRGLMMKDPIRWFGTLDSLHPPEERWNSGLIGLPPGYDFGAAIKNTWEHANKPQTMGYAEEQSLLTFCLKRINPFVVEIDEMIELLNDGPAKDNQRLQRPYNYTGNEIGFHFTEVNRSTRHIEWDRFRIWQKKVKEVIPLL